MKTDVKRKEKSRGQISVKEDVTLLNAIEQVVNLSDKSNLSDDFFANAEEQISYICKRMSITPIQAVLFAICVDNYESRSLGIEELAAHFKCRKIKILSYSNALDDLQSRRLIRCRKSKHSSTSYSVSHKVIDALKRNEAYAPKISHNIECIELFEELNELFEMRSEYEISYAVLEQELTALIEMSSHLAFTQKIRQYNLASINMTLLLFFCHLYVNHDEESPSVYDFNDFYDTKSVYRIQKKSLTSGYNQLIEYKIVESVNEEGFASLDSFKLTEAAKSALFSELDISMLQATKPDRELILHENIKHRQLFYNKQEQSQIEQLSCFMQQERYEQIKQNFSENNFKYNFACLFYGAPGTGKTETVYQLAKQTKRNIMQVNIPEIKSMWVGESEKNIKSVFDKYRACVEASEIAPILLFNEADAILGKRVEGALHAVDKMENSIQNIILQEMETLDGILIATTNFTRNLDDAFERRFLFKIEFGLPCIEAKCAIWKQMINNLTDEQARELASRYNLSGGQIENVARKHIIDKVVWDRSSIDLSLLREYCEQESISKRGTTKTIGFKA